ncbi:MAG: exodeoxyribonuclease VII large subunit [Anaerolineaceae bacterium]|nr:exodeoxyribonuclease VII large subunit [Anaerolineaceae bacterium]
MAQFELFAPPVLTVSDINRYIRQLMDSDEILQQVWVRGEISNLSQPKSGHVYFTLKDAGASLKCVIWRSTPVFLKHTLQDGQAIEAQGSISVYERDGQYQLYIQTLRPVGEGLLFQQFAALKNQLEAEGLFDADRKQALPVFPKRIGIVTSPSAAALQDMLNTLRNRFPLAEVLLSPTSVQGQEAPKQIVQALQKLQQYDDIDVILVARGGGSLEDLWAFNDEEVARAIADCRIPVITGIGHETDFTLADFASDFRAPTPTAAAVAATPDMMDIRLNIQAIENEIQRRMEMRIADLKDDLVMQNAIVQRYAPQRKVYELEQQLDQMAMTLQRVIKYQQGNRQLALSHLSKHLQSANPHNMLKRGYVILNDEQSGERIHTIKQVNPEQMLRITLADGAVIAKSEKIIQFTESGGKEDENA